jgi:predicted Zn-dependent protease
LRKNPVSGKKELVLMTEEQEIAMGKEADPQVISEFGLYEDKALQDYLNQVGQKIITVSHRKNIKYTFRLLDAELIMPLHSQVDMSILPGVLWSF